MDFSDLTAVPPEVLTVIGEIIGTLTAADMPLNVQNSIGNWLQLIGQAILTYNAQQQLTEQGEGPFYGRSSKPSDRLLDLERRVSELEKTVAHLKK